MLTTIIKHYCRLQVEEFYDISRMTREFINGINSAIKKKDYSMRDVVARQQKILKYIDTSRKKQVKRIKANEVGTRNSMLYLSILAEGKNSSSKL